MRIACTISSTGRRGEALDKEEEEEDEDKDRKGRNLLAGYETRNCSYKVPLGPPSRTRIHIGRRRKLG